MTDSQLQSPWLAPGYGDITQVAKVGDDLEVTFANGDLVRIDPSILGVAGGFELGADVDLDGTGVRIATPSGVRDISWMQLRIATDPAFARQMRDEDANEARRIAHRLKALREDRGLSQRDVATLAGMTPPQLSKIESGSFDLRVSTVQALLRAMDATLGEISRPGTPEISQKVMRRRAADAGISRDLVDRLIRVGSRNQVVALVGRAFDWTADALASGAKPQPVLAGPVQFKTTTHAADPAGSPLLTLGTTIAEVVRRHIDVVATPGPIEDPAVVRTQMVDASGQLTLESMVEWMWDRGIPVIPLHGKGGFCAAVFTVGGGSTVIVKETRDHLAYWMFDIAHELGHIALGHVDDTGIVDVDALTPAGDTSHDAQEDAANEYALALLLNNASDLLGRVEAEARGSHLRFKGAVVTVARQANVNAGLLGVVAAKALTHVGEHKDRWGSANNLSLADGAPRPVLRNALQRRLTSTIEPELDRLLVEATVFSD